MSSSRKRNNVATSKSSVYAANSSGHFFNISIRQSISILSSPSIPLLLPMALLFYLSTHLIPILYQHEAMDYENDGEQQQAYMPSRNPDFNRYTMINMYENDYYNDDDSDFYYFDRDVQVEMKDPFSTRTCIAPKDRYVCTTDPWNTISDIGSSSMTFQNNNRNKNNDNNSGNNPKEPKEPKKTSNKKKHEKKTNRNEKSQKGITYEQAMKSLKQLNIGVPQRIDGSEAEKEAVKQVMIRMEHYFRTEVMTHPAYYYSIRDLGVCQNSNELCAFWTSVGECESNRGFMLSHCSASCRLCALLYMNLNTMLHS